MQIKYDCDLEKVCIPHFFGPNLIVGLFHHSNEWQKSEEFSFEAIFSWYMYANMYANMSVYIQICL